MTTSNSLKDDPAVQTCRQTIVGSCGGFWTVPSDQLADYYRSHLYTAALGTAALAVWAALNALNVLS
jgi:hypothetical protein